MKSTLTIIAASVFCVACTQHNHADDHSHEHDHQHADHSHHENDDLNDGAKDITNVLFTSRAANCSEYADDYQSRAKDVNQDTLYTGSLKITLEGDKCLFSTNAIPNHDFNDGSRTFRNPVSEQDVVYAVPQTPMKASKVTELSLRQDNAVFLNGVKLDLLAAGCFGVRNGFIGCGNMEQPFRFDPMSPLNSFGTDSHNAHTQPDGTYHYHGNPLAMFSSNGDVASPVIGFAADGFPIYGSYFDDEGVIRKAKSSYVLKQGLRKDATFSGKLYAPGGEYDGKFVDDYEFDQASGGDLDECNGMTVNGTYGYYVTDTYPWVLKCFTGTPDSSFNKRRR